MSLVNRFMWVPGEKRSRARRAMDAWSHFLDIAMVMELVSASLSKDWNTMPLLSSISSGIPPISVPATGVPAHNDSTTLNGLFSYHCEGTMLKRA